MNDLAERGLQGVGVARRRIATRPAAPLAVVGFIAASVVVVSGGRIGAAPDALPLNTWLGLLPRAGYQITDLLPGLIMLAAIAALCACWLAALSAVRIRRISGRGVWLLALAWATPLLVGPPVLSTDAFGYVARGLLSATGLSPYHHAAIELDETPLTNAIDPTWRSATSTDGPLTTALEHVLVIVGANNPLACVILLRALALGSVAAIGLLAADLAGRRRTSALAMTLLNPVTLLYLLSGAHLDALFIALILAALLAAAQRGWTRALVLVCLAAGLKPVGLVAVAAVLVAHAGPGRRRASWQRVAAGDSVLAVAVLAACVLAVPYGLGWLDNVDTIIREHTPYAPASLLSDVVSWIVPSASFDDLAAGGRIAVALAGLTALGYLLLTVRSRSLERTVGYALLVAALSGPILLPWYLTWGALVVAPTAVRVHRDWVIALSIAASVVAPAGFAPRTTELVSAVALLVVAGGLAPRELARYRRAAAAQRRARGRLSAG